MKSFTEAALPAHAQTKSWLEELTLPVATLGPVLHPELAVMQRRLLELYREQHAYLAGKPQQFLEELLHRCEEQTTAADFSFARERGDQSHGVRVDPGRVGRGVQERRQAMNASWERGSVSRSRSSAPETIGLLRVTDPRSAEADPELEMQEPDCEPTTALWLCLAIEWGLGALLILAEFICCCAFGCGFVLVTEWLLDLIF